MREMRTVFRARIFEEGIDSVFIFSEHVKNNSANRWQQLLNRFLRAF